MCGIVLKTNFDGSAVNNAVLEQYDKQSHRGKRGFGLFTLNKDRPQIVREASEDGILKWLCGKNSHFIMFHHRLPTSTINVAKAAHPHSTGDYFGDTQYILVHNGVIRNASKLFVDHQELGIDYHSFLSDLTFNDSESLLWDLALTLEGQQKEMKAEGGMAFICLKTHKGKLERMYFGRNTNPLNMFLDKDTLELSSEGRGVPIESNTLYQWDFEEKRLYMEPMTFPSFTPVQSFRPTNVPVQSAIPNTSVSGTSEGKVFDSYDDWYENRNKPDKEKKWEALRRKYHYLVDKAEKPIVFSTQSGASRVAEVLTTKDHAYEASQNKDGSWSVNPKQMTLDIDDIMQHRKDFEPTPAEVQKRAMEYLIECKGIFEQAYALLEFEYEQFLEDLEMAEQTFEDVREQLLMEAALEFINSDPEYVNENSVCAIAEGIYYRQEEEARAETSSQSRKLLLA